MDDPNLKVKGPPAMVKAVMRMNVIARIVGYICVSAVIIAMIGLCGWSPRCAPTAGGEVSDGE